MEMKLHAGGKKEQIKQLRREMMKNANHIDQDFRSNAIKKYLFLIKSILPKSEKYNLY